MSLLLSNSLLSLILTNFLASTTSLRYVEMKSTLYLLFWLSIDIDAVWYEGLVQLKFMYRQRVNFTAPRGVSFYLNFALISCICLYLFVSVCIYLYLFVSGRICLYLLVSGRICLYLVVSACICLLAWPIFFFQFELYVIVLIH
jgi:hypothetical protein